jgi:hypothetical protein
VLTRKASGTTTFFALAAKIRRNVALANTIFDWVLYRCPS